MTKKEIARAISEHMNKINNDVDIERMTNVLIDKMTTKELNAALRNYEK